MFCIDAWQSGLLMTFLSLNADGNVAKVIYQMTLQYLAWCLFLSSLTWDLWWLFFWSVGTVVQDKEKCNTYYTPVVLLQYLTLFKLLTSCEKSWKFKILKLGVCVQLQQRLRLFLSWEATGVHLYLHASKICEKSTLGECQSQLAQSVFENIANKVPIRSLEIPRRLSAGALSL